MLRGQFATYEVRDLVARGRSGQIFRGFASDGRPVALKVHDRGDVGLGEAERLAAVQHPLVIDLLDHGCTDSGQVWLALPWVSGQTLAAFLAAEAPIELDRARPLVDQLAAAVDALHEAGIVHGDLSPNNVLIDNQDRITVIDLGASDAINLEAIDETTGIEVNVTPRYASPEVARGDRSGPAGDRYAVALIAYELLTGSFPFPDVATPIAMLAHHASTEPVAPSEHRPDLPAAVDTALLAGLAKKPDQRPGSAVHLANALAANRGSHRQPVASLVPRRTGRLVGTGLLAAVGLSAVALQAANDDPVRETWAANQAAGLSCNTAQSPGFESDTLPQNFYGGDPTNTTSLAAGDGIDSSAALRVGADDRFGLYGEIIPIIAGRRYMFSGFVRQDGPIETAAVYIDYLNENYQQLTAYRDLVTDGFAVGSTGGTRVTIESQAPLDAAYAVPTIFKNGSPGSLLVDEVVFGLSDVCPDLTS